MKRAAAFFAFLALAAFAPSVGASQFEVVPGSFAIRPLDREGNPELRSGSHPDRLRIDFALHAEGTSTRDLALELPPGISGNPGAVPACPRAVVEAGEEQCPPESQIGVIALDLNGGGEAKLPVFEAEPGPGEAFAIASVPGFEATMSLQLRPGDLGMTFAASNFPEVAVSEGHFELWGVPADHQTETSIPRRPFLTLPATCGPLAATIRVRSREPEAPWLSAAAESAPLGGCGELAFKPRLGLELGDPRADSPTGARIELSMPEGDDPDGLGEAQIESATIELPEGLTVSPAGAAGLTACSDAQLGLGSSSAAACPAASKVGTVEVASPELREPLTGVVYLGQELPGERFRMFIVAPGPGVVLKFVAAMQVDLLTGRLSTVLSGLPQLPLSRLSLNIDGGPRALLASPLSCGTFPGNGRFEPYGEGAAVVSSAAVTIAAEPDGAQCQNPPPFSPGLLVSTSAQRAGRPTSFSMSLLRRPGEQLARRFSVSLPQGLNAGLAGIETCPDSAAAFGTCPAGSRMGSASATAGSGASPVAIGGDVYLAGPYRGAPFSIAMAFRAAAGPFDLGRTSVRAALEIDRRSGRISVVTDPLPALIAGVPVRFQTIGMNLDRPGLMRNPTSCAPAQVDADIEAAGGASASATSSLKVIGCKRLGFRPRFSMALSGRSQLRRHGKPGLRIGAHLRGGDTALRSMRVSLPPALKLDIAGLRELCPRRDAIEGLCSAKSRVGTALARSPLLAGALKGSVYVVQPRRNEDLPDLWVGVGVGGLRLDLKGTTAQRHGHMVIDLAGLPDMPLSDFSMRLRGGKLGAIALGSSPCGGSGAAALLARLVATGQNGASRHLRLPAAARCGKADSLRDG